MNGYHYLRDRLSYIIINLILMTAMSLFLISVGNSYSTVLFILLIWCIVCVFSIIVSFYHRKQEMELLLKMITRLEEKYLIAEIMNEPARSDDKIYYDILKASSKSMLEHIAGIRRERREYQEYIEEWIHEIKTPIAAMKLLCENNKSDFSKTCILELNKINHFSEQALFYARSECVEKDYYITDIPLSRMIHTAVTENKELLLQNNAAVEIVDCDNLVYTDEKWIVFILNQMIYNSVKYKKEQLSIQFRTEEEKDFTYLYVSDNGIGINESDLPRIFEKGFTGSNGRKTNHSTGIGLYLCKKLCEKLGVGILVSSSGSGTDIRLTFYKNHYIRVQED